MSKYTWQSSPDYNENADPEKPFKTSLIERRQILSWAISRWEDEVQSRPPQNIHYKVLDETWRQVIRKFGADDVDLIGPQKQENQ